MARWSVGRGTFTPVAVADTTAFTDGGYFAIQGGSSTQKTNVLEVFLTGQATSSAAAQLMLARDSTVGATLSVGLGPAALDPASAALAAPLVAFSTATTKPQRSSTLQLLNCSFNAFGGLLRWVAAPGEEIGMLGNTASLGELSISHLAGGTPGLIGATMILETM